MDGVYRVCCIRDDRMDGCVLCLLYTWRLYGRCVLCVLYMWWPRGRCVLCIVYVTNIWTVCTVFVVYVTTVWTGVYCVCCVCDDRMDGVYCVLYTWRPYGRCVLVCCVRDDRMDGVYCVLYTWRPYGRCVLCVVYVTNVWMVCPVLVVKPDVALGRDFMLQGYMTVVPTILELRDTLFGTKNVKRKNKRKKKECMLKTSLVWFCGGEGSRVCFSFWCLYNKIRAEQRKRKKKHQYQ